MNIKFCQEKNSLYVKGVFDNAKGKPVQTISIKSLLK